jgi:hypothetical protein
MAADTLPRKIIELNKAIAQTAFDNTTTVIKTVGSSVKAVADASRVAGKTVVGQTRSVLDRTWTTAVNGTKEVTGQATAQGARVANAVDTQANRVVDRAITAVEDKPTPGTPYGKWTKEQLYVRAQELDLDGRAGMNKKQLIEALRK